MHCHSLHAVRIAQAWLCMENRTRCAGFAGADLQALCTGAVMAALRRSSPEVLLDPRLEEGIPFIMPPAAAPEGCAPGGQEQLPGSLQSPPHASSTATDPRQAGPHSNEGADKQQTSGAPLEATGMAQGTSLRADGLQPSEQQMGNERPQPDSGKARRHESAHQGATIGPACLQQDAADTAWASLSMPLAASSESQAPTALAQSRDAPNHDRLVRASVIHPENMPSTEAASALEALEVRACDWREALMSAPEACARRGSMAAMSAAAAQALPAHLAPALLPACASALQVCYTLKALLSPLRCCVLFCP